MVWSWRGAGLGSSRRCPALPREAAGMECKRSRGRDPRSDRYCELGRGPPARPACLGT